MEYVDRGVEEKAEEKEPIERHAVELFECTMPLQKEDKKVEELATATATVSGLAFPLERWPEVSDDTIAELQRQQEQLARLRQLREYECDKRDKLTLSDDGDCTHVEDEIKPKDIQVCFS